MRPKAIVTAVLLLFVTASSREPLDCS